MSFHGDRAHVRVAVVKGAYGFAVVVAAAVACLVILFAVGFRSLAW